MSDTRPVRILVVTDHANPTTEVIDAVRRRAQDGHVQFRLIVLNPARAEAHLLHPDRRDKASEAELVLRDALPRLRDAAGGPVVGSVSVRHDPMDAIEETIFNEPIDEVMLALPEHHFSTWLHQDLAHRLTHYQLPVTVVPHDPKG